MSGKARSEKMMSGRATNGKVKTSKLTRRGNRNMVYLRTTDNGIILPLLQLYKRQKEGMLRVQLVIILQRLMLEI